MQVCTTSHWQCRQPLSLVSAVIGLTIHLHWRFLRVYFALNFAVTAYTLALFELFLPICACRATRLIYHVEKPSLFSPAHPFAVNINFLSLSFSIPFRFRNEWVYMRARWMEEGTVWFDHDCVGGLVALLFVGRWGVVFLLSRLVWRFSTSTANTINTPSCRAKYNARR